MRRLLWLTLLALLALAGMPAAGAAQGGPIYLPLVLGPPGPPVAPQLRVNAPYFNVADVDAKFAELAVFWFGKVTPAQNYADVRVGYNDTELFVYLAAFDRRIWYDTSPAAADLTAWDAVSLYLDTSGAAGSAPAAGAYRFVAQFSGSGGAAYQAAYRGNGASWSSATVAFSTRPGWRGSKLNDDTDDKGWVMTFRIPFASLGMAAPPAAGSSWGLALALHDRDTAAGDAIADQLWPPGASPGRPASWGGLVFGLPGYSPPATSGRQVFTVRHGLNGATVADAAVGGGSTCGQGLEYWSQWGERNYAGDTTVNVQNQSDIADWPCFSKYYLTFPLSALPAGKAVVSATLTLHQMGNSGAASNGDQPQPSVIQIFTVAEDWSEATLSWNNAPLATENVSRATVGTIEGCGAPGGLAWPCVARSWDLSRAVARAYAAGQPLRIALYSADSAYSSGKYFISSDAENWNAAGRPTLTVTLGTPAGE